MRGIWRVVTGSALLALAVLAVAAAGYLHWSSRQPVVSGSDSFVIETGSGVKQIAARLVSEGILAEPYTFIAWSYVNDYTTRIHAGEYAIPDGTSVNGLLDLFVDGTVIQRSVTFIEGWSFDECLDALYAAEKLRLETQGLDNEAIMTQLGAAGRQPEGRFFPDTYRYTADMSDLDILGRALAAMTAVLDEEWANRDESTVLKSKDEALVLASIIEKETGRAGERRTIAAVFHNRLERGMRLQTDPTVIYGLGEDFDGNLTRTHLNTDTPYNTYTRAGLPPTPIAMPGRASIHAALHPTDSDALYFVSKGDGSHVFSKTLEEHNRNVFKYQIDADRESDPQEPAVDQGDDRKD